MSDLFQIAKCNDELAVIVRFIRDGIFPMIQIGIPIILIVMGSMDLGKAVLSSDDKAIKESQGRLIKRCISAVLVFFIVTIVQLITGVIADNGPTDSGANDWRDCWNANKGSNKGD